MTDDVKALIAEARSVVRDDRSYRFVPEPRLLLDLADALEAASVAPAVDRETLARVLSDPKWQRGSDVREWPEDEAEAYREEGWSVGIAAARAVLVQKQVDALLAALGARDVRDVQAGALEQAAAELEPKERDIVRSRWLRARAQAIREARNG